MIKKILIGLAALGTLGTNAWAFVRVLPMGGGEHLAEDQQSNIGSCVVNPPFSNMLNAQRSPAAIRTDQQRPSLDYSVNVSGEQLRIDRRDEAAGITVAGPSGLEKPPPAIPQLPAGK